MPNLYYHRMMEGYPERLYSSVPYAAGYSKRAFVLTSPGSNDHVIIDPSKGVDMSFPELTLLNEQGLGPRPENVHIAGFNHRYDWEHNRNENNNLIDKLVEHEFDHLFPFTGKSTICHLLADELAVPIRSSDSKTAYWAEDKRSLLDNRDLSNVPAGFKVNTNGELLKAYSKLLGIDNYTGTAVVKASHSASGTVSSIIKNEGHLLNFTDEFNLIDLNGGVIQEWHESDERSPSINYFIFPDGSNRILFISNQIFEDSEIVYGMEGTRIYRGNSYPTDFSEEICNKIIENTSPLIKALYKGGYWGPVGFDTIVVDESENFVTEINPRITGPHFGWRPMKNLGLSCFSLQNESIDPQINFSKLRKSLDKILYRGDGRCGYIIFNFFPGKFIGLIVSDEPETINEIRQKSAELLKKLKS